MRLKDTGDFLVYLVVRLLICLVQALRIETCAAAAGWLAWLIGHVIRPRDEVIDENLRLAFPEMSAHERRRLTRRMWEHLLLMAIEAAHAPRKIHDTNWRQYLHLKDMRPMMRLFFADRPSVAVSAHFGNFELAAFAMRLFGLETFAVARPLDNRFLDRFIARFRSASVSRLLPKNGSAPEIAELLARRGMLSVLADQHAGPKGCWVDFFGRPASTHKAIALFALANEAPLMVGYVRRLGRPLEFEMAIEAVADPRRPTPEQVDALKGVAELTQWYTHQIERIIRRDPQQYWWVHRRWKEAPASRRQARAA